jgi:hypothetical protein
MAAVSGAELPPLVVAMIDNMPVDADERCSYSRTRIGDDGTRIERFRADRPDAPWALVNIDGRPPTVGETLAYSRKAEDRDRRHPLAFDLRSMVSEEGWQLRSESADQTVFEFRLRPTEELDERLVAKVVGTLVVQKSHPQPVHISITNTEPAYVAPLIRVADYSQQLSFRWNDSVGLSVLSQVETTMRGRAAGLKTLRRHKLVLYGDYLCKSP